MTFRIAINGYGRIGRCLVRALRESASHDFELVAINEPADLDSIAYLTRYDSTHGRYPGHVEVAGKRLLIDGRPILVSHARTPDGVDWSELDIDLLFEASGRYARRHELELFLDAGCRRLLLSHPGHEAVDLDRTIVFGFNHESLSGAERLISAASCTTNAIVPILSLLDGACGIEHAILTTLHSVMNDQPLIDAYHHDDLRRNRSAMQSLIPVATGLSRGVERLMPNLAGRIAAKSVRVPVPNVSAIDMCAVSGRAIGADEIDLVMRTAAAGALSGLLSCTDEPHASIDFNHSPFSAIIDRTQTRINGDLVNLLVWFDNEWGFANRMLELAGFWLRRAHGASV